MLKLLFMDKKPLNSSSFGLKGVAQTVAQAESAMPKYIERRGNVYWFRRRAPTPLKPGSRVSLEARTEAVHANGYIRFSLDTSSLKEAGQLARKYAHLLDEAAKEATASTFRKRLKNWEPVLRLDPAQPTSEEIQFAADSMFAGMLGLDEHFEVEEVNKEFNEIDSSDGEDLEQEREFAAKVLASILGVSEVQAGAPARPWSLADLPPATPQGQAQLIKNWLGPISLALSQYVGKTVSQPTAALLPFAYAIRRYVAAAEQRSQSIKVPTPPLPHKGELWGWQDTFDYYFEQRAHLGEGTYDNYSIAWTSLAESAKGRPAGLTREAVVAWRDKLLGEIESITVKNKLTYVKAIWRESRTNGKIPVATPDPFDGLRVRIDPNARGSRTEYSFSELQTLFSAPPVTTASAVSEHAGYWLPLLGLHHGARLEEVAGLEVQDIEDWGGSFIIHIRINTIRPRLKHGKRSERSVPAHPKLMELGFRDYVYAARKAGVFALFPCFSRGATFGEAYVEHVKSLLSPVEGRLVGMHPLRHSWETARRNGRLDLSAAQYITGRKIEHGSSADYGSPAGLLVLLDELSKITYPVSFLPAPPVTPEELKKQDEQRVRNQRAKKKVGATPERP